MEGECELTEHDLISLVHGQLVDFNASARLYELPIEIPGHVRAGVVYDGTLRGALKEYQRSRAPGGKCFSIGNGPLAIDKYEGGMLPPAVHSGIDQARGHLEFTDLAIQRPLGLPAIASQCDAAIFE